MQANKIRIPQKLFLYLEACPLSQVLFCVSKPTQVKFQSVTTDTAAKQEGHKVQPNP